MEAEANLAQNTPFRTWVRERHFLEIEPTPNRAGRRQSVGRRTDAWLRFEKLEEIPDEESLFRNTRQTRHQPFHDVSGARECAHHERKIAYRQSSRERSDDNQRVGRVVSARRNQVNQGALNGPLDRQMPVVGIKTLEESFGTVGQIVSEPEDLHFLGALAAGS